MSVIEAMKTFRTEFQKCSGKGPFFQKNAKIRHFFQVLQRQATVTPQ